MEEKNEVIKNEEVEENTPVVEEKQTKEKKKRKRSPIAIILNILATLFFLFIVFETVIAFLNFNSIKQNKEPEYFVTTESRSKDGYDYTIYKMGLYKIVRKENDKNYEIKLLPFFLDI